MQWLTLHNELEGDHAQESLDLARLVPKEPAPIDAVRRGAVGLHRALWLFLDEMYSLCFSSTSSLEDSRTSIAPPSVGPLSVGSTSNGPISVGPISAVPASIGPMSLMRRGARKP